MHPKLIQNFEKFVCACGPIHGLLCLAVWYVIDAHALYEFFQHGNKMVAVSGQSGTATSPKCCSSNSSSGSGKGWENYAGAKHFEIWLNWGIIIMIGLWYS